MLIVIIIIIIMMMMMIIIINILAGTRISMEEMPEKRKSRIGLAD